jgi:hypothetical protein
MFSCDACDHLFREFCPADDALDAHSLASNEIFAVVVSGGSIRRSAAGVSATFKFSQCPSLETLVACKK